MMSRHEPPDAARPRAPDQGHGGGPSAPRPAGHGDGLTGRGFGHGVGLAQDGELTMGRQGDSADQILGQFYPGTSLARTTGTVRVQVLSATPASATVVFPSGGQIQDAYSGPQSP